jgi:hypothetical protein
VPPLISLADEYKLVDQLEPLGVPSLIGCKSLKVSGPVHFADGVLVQGEVEISNASSIRKTLPPGAYQDLSLTL